jgi:predicted DNA repair protein MutK
MMGGLFLCFEGSEKVLHVFFHSKEEEANKRAARLQAMADEQVDLVALEKDKVKGAIRTDFILSAEIIVITLGTVATASIERQLAVLIGISLLITAGVYGLVAGIVKLDDAGLYLSQRAAAWQQALGNFILKAAPLLMKTLSVVGTAAMFLVGGGILMHGVPVVGHTIEQFTQGMGWVGVVLNSGAGAVVGLLAGTAVVGLVHVVQRLRSKSSPAAQ